MDSKDTNRIQAKRIAKAAGIMAFCLVFFACVTLYGRAFMAGPPEPGAEPAAASSTAAPEGDGGAEDTEAPEDASGPQEEPAPEAQPGGEDAAEAEAPAGEEAGEAGLESPANEEGPAPLAFQDGEAIVDGVVYKTFANGEAELSDARAVNGPFVVPRAIAGPGGETYLVTAIGTYESSFFNYGAFQGSAITGLSFEAGSQLRSISVSAFEECYGLVGTSITLPQTVTSVGYSAFFMGSREPGIAELRHPHIAQVSGSLPSLAPGAPPTLPPEAAAYESTVNSSQTGFTLHKGASWTDAVLTQGEIRIDYGQAPEYNGKIDFVFVLDYSSSMLDTVPTTSPGGEAGTYPRSFLTNDVVFGASEILLGANAQGYDNRVAMVAFGSDDAALWASGFTASAADVENTLFTHPLTVANNTNYSAGLQGAIELIAGRGDTSRTPVVIFLSDGAPTNGNGTDQAQTLRAMGVRVYPVSIFVPPTNALRAISWDGQTAYDAEDTATFETIIPEIADEIITLQENLDIVLRDVLSAHFQLATGTQADIAVSPGGGTVAINGDTLDWDLTGCAPGVDHFIRIQVRLAEGTELTASGLLPANASLGDTAGNVTTSAQPQLARYLARHAFANGTAPGEALPAAVLALLPPNAGGFRTGAQVAPTAPAQTTVQLPNGDRWLFEGWDKTQDTVADADVLFTGTWRLEGLDFAFTKTDFAGSGLAGAQFELYIWRGAAPPAGADAYVTPASTAADKWQSVATAASGAGGATQLRFAAPGLYQLVETAPAAGYVLPQAQWRFTVTDAYQLAGIVTVPQDEDAVYVDDFTETGGTPGWALRNFRQAQFSFRKISSVHYHDGETSAQALAGAEFAWYYWSGDAPPPAGELVNEESLQQGVWKPAGTAASGGDGTVTFTFSAKDVGYYQLVETKAPDNYQLPMGQWRVTITQGQPEDTYTITGVPGPTGAAPPPLQVMPDGAFAGELALVNIPLYELPALGGMGRLPFAAGGSLLLLAGGVVHLTVRRRARRRQMKRLLHTLPPRRRTVYRKRP